jgi:hypothetical protein
MRLWYFHRLHRGWEVAARGHPIPDLVEVPLEILLEVLDRAAVHSRCALVGLHLPIGFPHLLLRNVERLARCLQLVHSAPPGAPPVDQMNQPQMTQPLGSTPVTGASWLLRAGPPARPATVLNPSQFRLLGGLPVATLAGSRCRGAPSHVPCESSRSGSRRLHAGHRLASQRAPARLLPRAQDLYGFDATLS